MISFLRHNLIGSATNSNINFGQGAMPCPFLLSGRSSDSGHFTTQSADCVKDFIDPLLRRLLNAIDVPGKKALVDADGARHLRHIQLREALEDIADDIVGIRLLGVEETCDMDVFVDIVPTKIVAVDADLIAQALFWRGFKKQRECLQRPAVSISFLCLNVTVVIIQSAPFTMKNAQHTPLGYTGPQQGLMGALGKM